MFSLFSIGCAGPPLPCTVLLQLPQAGAPPPRRAPPPPRRAPPPPRRALPCDGLACCTAQALEQAGVSSCDTRTQLSLSVCNLPGAGVEPVSPALVGAFVTIGPPGKSLVLF